MASCHTHAATKLSSHRTLRSLTICVYLCASVGGSSPPEASVYSVNSVGEPYVATKLSSPQNSRNTETTGGEYPPTDCTDVHRLGGYGIPAIPTQPPDYLPTEFTEHTETTGGEEKSVNSVKSVGGSSTPEASVYSVQSVGEYPPPEASVNSVGGLAQTNLEWVLWKEFGGRRGYGRDAIPSYENSHGLHGCAQIRRVWHPCHTHAATKLSSHRIHGTHRNDWRRRKICVHL